ncbi:MAG: oxidoreductase [Acidobacteria bacterium]|nr:oxidoreductase [Acidobacteriota bacterium]MCI0624601.1 oxidoreductase [Acidobacteriota bacterium]MCI0723520.1 oxidoreductase [Acidobacteriota bacterium]
MIQKKVALVTGVSSGIGRATATLLLDRGFRTFGTLREMNRASEFSTSLELVRLDVREEESVRSCVQAVLDQAGRIDLLVNNAGCALVGSLEETSIEEARATFETNFFGVLRMCQAVLPSMRKKGGGRIANISSVLGFLPGPYQGIYTASKHALEGYSESLDHEVRQFGIRISLIEPGFTRTSIGQNARVASEALEAYANERKRVLDAIQKSIATGADPGAVASVVLEALTSRSPRLRYPAGREAKFLSRLRKFAPSRLLDNGLRKQFGLQAA